MDDNVTSAAHMDEPFFSYTTGIAAAVSEIGDILPYAIAFLEQETSRISCFSSWRLK